MMILCAVSKNAISSVKSKTDSRSSKKLLKESDIVYSIAVDNTKIELELISLTT